jgi:hypothetical protein
MIAPDRIASSLASFLETHTAEPGRNSSQGSLAATGLREMQHDIQLAWDSLNYQWDLHVLNFDEDAQNEFLLSLGLGSISWVDIFFWVLIATALIVAALSYLLLRPRGRGDPVARGYAAFCRALARSGLPREPWEGAQHFSARARQHFPDQAKLIERISALYIELRYSPHPADPRPFLAAVRRLPRFAPTSGT